MYVLIYVLTILLLPVVLLVLWTYEVWKKYKGYLLVGGELVLIIGLIGCVAALEWAKRARVKF